MSRDIRKLTLQQMRKCELRALIVEMRLRHDDEVTALLAAMPPEEAVRLSFARARKAMDRLRDA